MNRKIYITLAAALLGSATTVFAQSALDAYSISQNDLRGTARFMSMAGAFGALGGDLSTLVQNPAGIGVYRSSEIGVTLDIDCQKAATSALTGSTGFNESYSQTKVACNNFGYVGAINTNSDLMPFFNWGASYNRAVSFDRVYSGHFGSVEGSLTNQIAANTNFWNWTADDLSQWQKDYNPYQDSYAPWLSILAFNNYLINPTANGFEGLYNGEAPSAEYWVRDRGHVDEYSINFGGNFVNMVYWGLGFGITDMSFKQETFYDEEFTSARVPNAEGNGVTNGNGGFGLNSWKHIYGTGFNMKFGVIVKPINELRIGLAVHTPTWYSLTQEGMASVDYNFSTGYYPTVDNDFAAVTDYGYSDYFLWKARSPWRLIASVAGVVDGRFILSADYEYRAYQRMNIADNSGNDGNGNPDSPFTYVNDDVQAYYRQTNTIRLGAEMRLTPQVSLRAGYSYETSPVTDATFYGNEIVYTDGPDQTETTPSYTLDRSTQYITCGLGYRYKGFYVDAAYVHKYRQAEYHGFSPRNADGALSGAPVANLTNHNNQIVLSVGFKF